MDKTMKRKRALSLRLAERVGDHGFLPAKACPQGHSTPGSKNYGGRIGDFCWTCRNTAILALLPPGAIWDERHRDPPGLQAATDRVQTELANHPEWHIQRGEPLPYAEDETLIHRLAGEWCRHQHGIHYELGSTGRASWAKFVDEQVGGREVVQMRPDPAEALAAALDAAIDVWGWRPPQAAKLAQG